MTFVEIQPHPAPQTLIECKYDHSSNDIFLFLTREGLVRLRKGDSNRNFTLTVFHEKTKARFDLINTVSNDNDDVLEVLDNRPLGHPYEWYWVKLDDRGYKQLQDALISKESEETTVMTRYGTGFKVSVTVDEEMVMSLARTRLKNKT